jgi:putative ribosome biogenesis GTPase RsgA
MIANAAGLVTATHRRHYAVRLDDGETVACILRGRSLAIACGDRVEVERSPSNEGTIVSVAPRTTLFYRSDIQRGKLLAATVTQVWASWLLIRRTTTSSCIAGSLPTPATSRASC